MITSAQDIGEFLARQSDKPTLRLITCGSVDARKGVLTQTRRHSRIVALMGIRHVILAVNKMDLVAYDHNVFTEIVNDYAAFAAELGFASIQPIPLSGLTGDNILQPSDHMPWYTGPSLMAYLDTLDTGHRPQQEAARLPIQWINRPHLDFRGLCGRLATGTLRVGDAVRLLPSGVTTHIDQIWVGFANVEQAEAGQSLTLTLRDAVDASRGDVLVAAADPPESADQFEAQLLWMSDEPLLPGRQYLLKHACREVTATITALKHRQDVNTGAHLAARKLHLNEIATVNLATQTPLVFEPYTVNPTLGAFILIDKLHWATVGAGMIDFALRRARNIHWQALELNKAARARQKHQTPRCLWFTGLSGSGKSTIANLLEKRLYASDRHSYLLDGDNIRHGLNHDLGFTAADRVENIRRVAEMAKLMVDAGLIVLVSFIAPFRSERRMARDLFAPGEFIEVFIDTPLEECERRDVKGLYAKARRGELQNFTGIDSPYEPPEQPELRIDGANTDPETAVEQLLAELYRRDTADDHGD